MRDVFFHLIVYIVTRYMYDAVRRDFALSASFVLECGFDVSDEDGGYNVFDSHARDMYHNSHSEGTCIVGNTIHA